MDDFLTDIEGFLLESHIVDLGDIIYDIHLLFDEVDPSLFVARDHCNPHVHSIHD